MKNASRLLYLVSGIFAFGFLYESVRLLTTYDAGRPAPMGMYLLAYLLFYLLPSVLFLILAVALGRKAEREEKGPVDLSRMKYRKTNRKNYK